MGLNKSKGNMYNFISHTWNTIKGECYHDCSYCYMKRFGKLNTVRFDEKELKTDLGKDNFIFVGSSNDMFAHNLDLNWILKTLSHCKKYPENRYFFQSKNVMNLVKAIDFMPNNYSLCTTIETNRFYMDIMNNSPHPKMRIDKKINYVTIEPIIDFDLEIFIELLREISPIQVNIGADSGKNNLPEPSKTKVLELIEGLNEFTKIHKKTNLKRLL